MRDLKRNQQPVFYRQYEGDEEIVDQYGNSTGNRIPIYGELKSAMMCVSPNKGTSETEQFGTVENYDRTITTVDTSLEIDEQTVLWVDGAETDGPWNYVVREIGRWKNSLQLAIAKVNVSVAEDMMKQIEENRERKAKLSVQEDVQV